MKRLWTIIGLIPLLIMSTAVWSDAAEDSNSIPEVMTLGQAISYALKNNPGINAERQKLGIAKGQKTQADMLIQFNPQLSGMYLNRNTPDNERYNDFQLGLSQKFEVAGQPGFRRAAARQNLKKVEWRIKDAERLLKAGVKAAFYNLLITKEKILLAQQILKFRREILNISQKRYEVGDISKLQVYLNQVGFMRAQKEQLEIKREYNRNLFRFKQIINWDMGKELEAKGSPKVIPLKLDKDRMLKFALANRPDLLALKHDLERAGKQAQLAYSKRIPNITFSANYQRDEGSDLIGGGINIPIPTFNWNQGNIEKSLAKQDVLEYQLFKSRTEINKEVLTAAANFNLAVAEVAIFTKEILPRLNETLELVKEAFRLGQIDQLTVTISQNEFIQTRFSYLEALSEYYQTMVELEKAAAEDIGNLSLLD